MYMYIYMVYYSIYQPVGNNEFSQQYEICVKIVTVMFYGLFVYFESHTCAIADIYWPRSAVLTAYIVCDVYY